MGIFRPAMLVYQRVSNLTEQPKAQWSREKFTEIPGCGPIYKAKPARGVGSGEGRYSQGWPWPRATDFFPSFFEGGYELILWGMMVDE